jgi:hypothetical protein
MPLPDRRRRLRRRPCDILVAVDGRTAGVLAVSETVKSASAAAIGAVGTDAIDMEFGAPKSDAGRDTVALPAAAVAELHIHLD